MRRLLGLVSGVLLALSFVAPVGAGGSGIRDVTIGSAVIDRSGVVFIQGEIYCETPMNVQIEWGQVDQVVGRKTSVRGGFGGWYENCIGLMRWETGARADSGKFTPGWATVSVKFQGWRCDEFGCHPLDIWGGAERYLKIVRAK